MAKYLTKECGDLNEESSDNDDNIDDDDDDDDDDADDDDDGKSKDAEVVEIGTGEASNAWQVSKAEIRIKGRMKLSCRHERQIREDKSAEQKAKPYQWLFTVRIKFVW